MSLLNSLKGAKIAELLRAFNSSKSYLFFDVSIFNAGVIITIKCTDTYKQINGNTWNGHDFYIENDDTTKFYISKILKERVNNPFEEDDLTPIQIKRISKIKIQ